MKKISLSFLCALAGYPAFCAAPVKQEPSVTATWIAFLPVIFFALILFSSLIGLRKNTIPLKTMLAEKDPQAVPADAAPPASVSRFIVFLSGLTALTLSACLSTFYIYQYFVNPASPPDLANLSNIIWGLGIGVVPYGVNKVANSIKGEAGK